MRFTHPSPGIVRRTLLIVMLAACGDDATPDYPACGSLRCTALSCDLDGDLCTCELDMGASFETCDPRKQATSPCCDFLPDQDAVRQCELPPPPGTCGVIACPLEDGSFVRINFCGPPTIDGPRATVTH